MTRYPVIVGPTAGGKTAVAVELALALRDHALPPGEVVTADAFQIYRGMDIGTAKPTDDERRGVPHHLTDLVDPNDPHARYTVHDWLAAAENCLSDLRARQRTPIVVGGTNLYVKAFLDGLFEAPEPSADIAQAVRAMTQPQRRAELAQVDPSAADRIDPHDERRTARALEVYLQTGTPITELQRQWDADHPARPEAVLVGLEWSVQTINTRINARVTAMFDQGLIEEARLLWRAGTWGPQAREAIGYKQLIPFFEGRCTRLDALEQVKIETRRFAKKQRTWLRRLRARPGSVWIDAEGKTPGDIAQTIVDKVFMSLERPG